MQAEFHGKIGDGLMGLERRIDPVNGLDNTFFKFFFHPIHMRGETVILGQLLQSCLGYPGQKQQGVAVRFSP